MDDFTWKCPLCDVTIPLWEYVGNTPGHYTTRFMEHHMKEHESGMIPSDATFG